MKKRLISLLLAFSMMLTFLPVGAVSAFAEENTIDPEKGELLQSGDIINDKFIEEHDGATTYQMRNNYASGVTISASKKVTINITGNIDYNGTLFNVSNSGNVTVDNNKNYTVKGGARVVSLGQGTITVNGGTYYGSGTETFLNFRYNKGVMWLNDINVIASGDNAVNNQGGEVHIKGGTYTSNSSPVIYNQTWDRDAGVAELVGIMTLTDVTVESTSSGTGTGVGNSGKLTITGGKVTAPGPALNTYSKGETTVESGDFSSTGDCAVRVYETLYLKGGTFTAPNGSAIQSRDDSAYTEISGDTIKDSKVGVEVVKGSVDLKKTTFQGNDIDIYLQEDQVITIESSFKNAATIECADPSDGRQLTKDTEPEGQENLNLTSANADYLVGYKKTEDGKEYRCLSKKVGVTVSGLEDEIKAGDSAEFIVTLAHEGNTGTGILTFGSKNGEIEYQDETGAYQHMPESGLEIGLGDAAKNQYTFRITPKNAGEQKLTATVVRDAVELGSNTTNLTGTKTLSVTGGTATVEKDGRTLNIVPVVTGDKKTYSIPEDNVKVTVTLDKTQIPEGMVFDMWTTGSFLLPSDQNYKAETITFTMNKSVDIAAQYRDATIEDDGSTVLGTAAIIGTAVVGTMVLGYQAYSLGTEFAGYLMDLPYFPANRSALAVMLWEDAGKPMPESERLYPDVGQEEQDMDLQHAARWAMENDLIPDRNEEGTAPEEMKFYPDNAVSRIDVLKAWQKAQELKKNA